MFKLPLALLTITVVGAFSAATAMAQQAAATAAVKVDVKDMKYQQTFTPQFQGSNIVDKRWKPKAWLEVDVTLDVKKANIPGDNSPFVDEIEVKAYVALAKTNAEGKMIMLTTSQSYVNASTKDAAHVLLFAAPNALRKLLDKDFFNADVRAVGVEVFHNGNSVGVNSTGGGKFWELNADRFSTVDGVLLPKEKTPFAPLWGDYDLETKK